MPVEPVQQQDQNSKWQKHGLNAHFSQHKVAFADDQTLKKPLPKISITGVGSGNDSKIVSVASTAMHQQENQNDANSITSLPKSVVHFSIDHPAQQFLRQEIFFHLYLACFQTMQNFFACTVLPAAEIASIVRTEPLPSPRELGFWSLQHAARFNRSLVRKMLRRTFTIMRNRKHYVSIAVQQRCAQQREDEALNEVLLATALAARGITGTAATTIMEQQQPKSDGIPSKDLVDPETIDDNTSISGQDDRSIGLTTIQAQQQLNSSHAADAVQDANKKMEDIRVERKSKANADLLDEAAAAISEPHRPWWLHASERQVFLYTVVLYVIQMMNGLSMNHYP
jgi:hypothetical protein